MTTKKQLIDSLRAFINQRPGFEIVNYGYDANAYRRDYRTALADKHDAETLLAAIVWRDSISADQILAASRGRN